MNLRLPIEVVAVLADAVQLRENGGVVHAPAPQVHVAAPLVVPEAAAAARHQPVVEAVRLGEGTEAKPERRAGPDPDQAGPEGEEDDQECREGAQGVVPGGDCELIVGVTV